MKEAIQYAATISEFTLDELMGAVSNTGDKSAELRALLRDDATEEDFAKLSAAMFMGMGHNAGTHPDKLGYEQIFEAIKRAFLSPVAANGAYLTRILDGTIGIVNNTVGIVFGSKTSIMKFVDFIKGLFTPLVRLNIFGK